MKTFLNIQNNVVYKLYDIYLNDQIGKYITLKFLDKIYCISCNNRINKSYLNGYCFICMKSLPECDICMLKPELCHFHMGTCRDSIWGEQNCMNDHIVYLANTDKIKIGITKFKNIPFRWIDQGAIQALSIFSVKNRLISGLLENAIKKYVSDKTNWRKMLKLKPNKVNLLKIKDNIIIKFIDKINEIKIKYGKNSVKILNNNVQDINYPILQYPINLRSFNLNKDLIINSRLIGIKGQYLIFDDGVINVSKYNGYKCDLLI